MDTSLMQLCVQVAADNAIKIGEPSIAALPLPLLTMISEFLSAESLNNWHEMLTRRGVPVLKTWQNHLIGRWPFKYKIEDVFLQKAWTLKEARQLYLQNHFHALFRCATVDPAGSSFDSFSTPLHRLRRKSPTAPPPSHFPELLLSLAPYVQQLTIAGSFDEVNYLRENRAVLDALVENTRSLVVYHLNRQRYSHMRAYLLEEFIVKGHVESLSLEHCVLDEPEWKDLITVCTGSAEPDSYPPPTVTGTKRKCEIDATLSSATKRLRHNAGETSSVVASCSEEKATVPPANETLRTCRNSLKSFSIYVTHSFDFSSILGGALRTWDSLEKIEIWQPDAYSFKMILPNEINRKVRSGQIKHGTISGCLAVAGQLPLFLEALLIRHGNGAEPMEHVELEGSYIWAGSQPLRDFRDIDNFRACQSLVLRESTISDDTCELLCGMFETDRALRTVRLHEVKLGIVWCHVSRTLQALAMRGQLEILELDKVNCSESCQILPSIIAELPCLKQLILKDCSLSFDAGSFRDFSRAVLHHPSLQVLVMSGNMLGPSACDLLLEMFTKSKPFPTLKMLDLKRNGIKGLDLINVIDKVRKFRNQRHSSSVCKLEFLNIGENPVGNHFTKLQQELKIISQIVHLWDPGRQGSEHVSQM